MHVFLWVLFAATVPNVTAGPELAEEAILVEAPIAQVTVFSDRARVRRRASQSLKAGVQVLRLSDLPGGVMMNTVRVACRGAQVLRIETIPIERERITIDQVDELVAKLELMTDKLSLLDAKVQVHGLELGFLNSVMPAAPVQEKERVGKAMPPVKPKQRHASGPGAGKRARGQGHAAGQA
ncbi:MAG: DUF4140 domain-containing protein [Deltaproteobacteria bacterium]|nr:DUF4140 domain-containing protein [Deltaproteobacteria bacterium]